MAQHNSQARVGSFHGPQHQYGLPVSVVKPPDNVITPVGSVTASTTPSADASLNQAYSDLATLLGALGSAGITAVK